MSQLVGAVLVYHIDIEPIGGPLLSGTHEPVSLEYIYQPRGLSQSLASTLNHNLELFSEGGIPLPDVSQSPAKNEAL